MYDYLKPNISKMEQMVTSLNAFHAQTHALDTHHQEQLNTFSNTLMLLFDGPMSFEGPAADAMMNLVSNYLQAEQSFVGVVGDTSPRLSTATNYCVTTANEIEQQLQSLYREADNYAYELDVDRSIPFAGRELRRVVDPTFPSEEELGAFCPLPPTAQMRVGDMDIDKMQWEGNMNTLGGEPLPPLPPTPSSSNIIFPPGTPIDLAPLSPQKQQEVQDLLAKYPGVSQSDIENLVRLGYDEASIKTFLDAGLKKRLTIEQLNAMLANIIANTKESVPFGFKSIEDFQSFSSQLYAGLAAAGYSDVISGLGGSAVTGIKYTTGQPFDVGRTSDFDIAIASPGLLAKAKALGIPLRSGGIRTGPLSDKQLKALGLYQLIESLSADAGRDVHFMIYDSILTAANRAPIIIIPNVSN